jgi:hypothetical protein
MIATTIPSRYDLVMSESPEMPDSGMPFQQQSDVRSGESGPAGALWSPVASQILKQRPSLFW